MRIWFFSLTLLKKKVLNPCQPSRAAEFTDHEFFRDTDSLFLHSLFLFHKGKLLVLQRIIHYVGGGGASYDKGQPSLHLPRGGPCVMSMSMPSGMRFHLSSRDWPLGRLKPHPLNHGVLWGDNAHGSGSGTGLHTVVFLTHIHPRLAMLSFPFWWLALAAGCFSVDCFKTKPFESRHGAFKLFNSKEHGSLNSGDFPGRLLTKLWQCFFSPQILLDSQSSSTAFPASLSAAEMRNPTGTSWPSPLLQRSFLVSEKRTLG